MPLCVRNCRRLSLTQGHLTSLSHGTSLPGHRLRTDRSSLTLVNFAVSFSSGRLHPVVVADVCSSIALYHVRLASFLICLNHDQGLHLVIGLHLFFFFLSLHCLFLQSFLCSFFIGNVGHHLQSGALEIVSRPAPQRAATGYITFSDTIVTWFSSQSSLFVAGSSACQSAVRVI
jgi:hypothetical protein